MSATESAAESVCGGRYDCPEDSLPPPPLRASGDAPLPREWGGLRTFWCISTVACDTADPELRLWPKNQLRELLTLR
eukprot:CAMPEP_0206264846 /NCGR_PEP_ID=MMETSP0047_2-20121206/29646_1 /ASSEMBLY_ACC=CAM_ASM_000192 /TAXON_ID=195065 /ORGANISM="Chroomonas mesostigmatica_cf, Strain CCMP1168" /LENGTH=76 /DNA_ID=CAMNT_0053692635 /DNA_START=31 /DNA_END=257 /DNA_ORIENTATION=-